MKNNKTKYSIQELLTLMINKQLEKYKLTIEDVEGIENWFLKYTFDTHEEYLEWKKYCINLLLKKSKVRFNKTNAEKEFNWIDLMYGLKQAYNTIERTKTEVNIK